MSFLIFAYRKMSLRRKINDLNFKLMTLTQKEQTMAAKVGQMQQAMSSAQSIMTAVNSSSMVNIQNSVYSQAYDANGQLKAGVDQNKLYRDMQIAQYEQMAKNSLFTGMFESVSKAQMHILNAQSTEISNEKASIESQLKLMNSEFEQVEKNEDAAAKQSAPKFGLG